MKYKSSLSFFLSIVPPFSFDKNPPYSFISSLLLSNTTPPPANALWLQIRLSQKSSDFLAPCYKFKPYHPTILIDSHFLLFNCIHLASLKFGTTKCNHHSDKYIVSPVTRDSYSERKGITYLRASYEIKITSVFIF